MEVGADEIVRLEEPGSRKHEIGQVGGVGLEQVEDDGEQVLALQCPAEVAEPGVRRGDVDVPAEQRLRP